MGAVLHAEAGEEPLKRAREAYSITIKLVSRLRQHDRTRTHPPYEHASRCCSRTPTPAKRRAPVHPCSPRVEKIDPAPTPALRPGLQLCAANVEQGSMRWGFGCGCGQGHRSRKRRSVSGAL